MPNQPKVQVKKKQKPEESSHTIKKEPMNRNTSFKTEWIHKGFAPETIQHAEAVGKRADQLSSSVVRNFFDHIKQIQMKVETMDNTSFANAFLILKPRFVYTLKRQSGKKENPIINQFKDEILKAFQAV
ncbi:MAG: CRISPR type III-A-associated protein Csm2 [bacterium]|jgi:CRISPR type III-A-associated protein Csm2